MSMHPNRQLVASGETGKNPSVCIWDSVALKTVSVLVKAFVDNVNSQPQPLPCLEIYCFHLQRCPCFV